MSNAETITSLQNARIKNLVKLRNRRPRDRQAYSSPKATVPLIAPRGRVIPEEVYFCPECFLGENEIPLIESTREKGSTLFELSRPAFEKVAYRDRPEEFLAYSNNGAMGSKTFLCPKFHSC